MQEKDVISEIESIERESEKIIEKSKKRKEEFIKKSIEKINKEKEEMIKEAEKEINKIKKSTDKYVEKEVNKFKKDYEKQYDDFKYKLSQLEKEMDSLIIDALEELLSEGE